MKTVSEGLGGVKLTASLRNGRPGARTRRAWWVGMGIRWEANSRSHTGLAPGPLQKRRLPASEIQHPSRPCLERESRASRVGNVVNSCSLCSGPDVLPVQCPSRGAFKEPSLPRKQQDRSRHDPSHRRVKQQMGQPMALTGHTRATGFRGCRPTRPRGLGPAGREAVQPFRRRGGKRGRNHTHSPSPPALPMLCNRY